MFIDGLQKKCMKYSANKCNMRELITKHAHTQIKADVRCTVRVNEPWMRGKWRCLSLSVQPWAVVGTHLVPAPPNCTCVLDTQGHLWKNYNYNVNLSTGTHLPFACCNTEQNWVGCVNMLSFLFQNKKFKRLLKPFVWVGWNNCIRLE